MGQAVRQTESDGVLACEPGRLRLAVEHASGWVRHTVHRRRGSAEGPSPTLIAVGNKDSDQAAMQAAESVAESQAVTGQAGNAGADRRGSARDHAA